MTASAGAVGGPWGAVGPDNYKQTEAEPRTMAILAADLVDVKKKAPVWHGQATVDSISNTQKGDEKQALESVKKMFKHYPRLKRSRWNDR
jgi:hypothetical protein